LILEKVYSSITPASRRESHINILEVIGNASFGGMEKYVLNFLTRLPVADFSVTCICPYESTFTATLRETGYAVYVTPISDDPVWRSIQLAAEISLLHKIDVFHAHMPKAHTLAALAGSLVNKPVVSSIHGMHFSSYEFGVTRLAGSHLITNCQEAYGQALGLGVPAERVSVIHNGVDINLFTPVGSKDELKRLIDVPAETKVIGFAGRLAHEKGPDLFLRIAKYVNYVMPDVHFVMIGQGDMTNELRKMCAQFELEKNVHFIGWQNDMAAMYRGLDLLVYTSRSDGTSLVMLEAMACGCPAVAMDVGGVREIVENRSTGLLAAPVQWEDAAIKVLDLLADAGQLRVMGAAARACVEKKFDLNEKIKSTANVLRQTALYSFNSQSVLHNSILSSGNGGSISLDNSALENVVGEAR
jgi:glycosyltransferase involved in cell wall biosynthesis